MRRNYVSFRYNLTKTEKRIKQLTGHINGKSGEQVGDVLADVGFQIRDIILEQYISTYSQHPAAIAARTYRLEEALKDVFVEKNRRYTVTLRVTDSMIWPLGTGPLYYARVQEEGGVTNWGITVKARNFLIAGKNAMDDLVHPALLEAYFRWIGEK